MSYGTGVIRGILLLSLFLFAIVILVEGQNRQAPPVKEWTDTVHQTKGVKLLLGVITREPEADQVLNVKSEDHYLPYEGKIIRKIIIKRLGFESTILDTARHMQTYIAKAANSLHVDTKEFVIRNNLYIKEGKPLNPYRVADNERTIRNLPFILDCRILIKRISKKSDSVDLIVLTRDVFSLGGSFDPQSASRYSVSVTEINAAGMGQSVQIGGLFDSDRNPKVAYELLYQKSNVAGTFLDASLGYSKMNSGPSIGTENERGFYFRLSRPLFHPFVRWAGGISLSNNAATNVYKKPDSTFANYRYNIQDYWVGYSFGQGNQPANLHENRNRKFIAVRGFQQYFTNIPTIPLNEIDRFVIRNRSMVLTQLTLFRQDFYKTQYILGFGRTEDVPYGYRLSFTTGWEEEQGNKRPYLGTELYINHIKPTGTILSYSYKVGGYLQNGKGEDGLLSVNLTRYSKIHSTARLKIRNQFAVGYAQLFNRAVKQGISIRDLDGVKGFRPDSLFGTQRVTLSQETVVFTLWKVLGFRIAPVARIDLALINRKKELFNSENFFSGFSLGIRARNENLILDTIELRLYGYPRTVDKIDHFRFEVSTNFRIKYPSNLVNPPTTVFNIL